MNKAENFSALFISNNLLSFLRFYFLDLIAVHTSGVKKYATAVADYYLDMVDCPRALPYTH